MSNVVCTLTICLLLVYFVAAAGCHCFDLSLSRVNKKLFQGSLQRLYFDKHTIAAPQKDPPSRKII